jgi:photosystem II stability/assembly factor-like uncharacterized protein
MSFLPSSSKYILSYFIGFISIVGLFFWYSHDAQLDRGEEDEGDKMALAAGRMEYELEISKDPSTGTIPNERLIEANNVKLSRQQLRVNARSGTELAWTDRGPNNVGGRSRAVLFDASDVTDNTVFAGAVGGGLWYTNQFKSADPNWLPVNDFFENIAVTAIAQDPTNNAIIYFGTGEGYYNGGALRGNGIWKTTDGGSSWTQLSSTNNSTFYYVQDIVVEPENGYVYASTRDGGVQLSKDGGSTWTQVLGSGVSYGSNNQASDLEVGPTGQVFATLGIFSQGAVYKTNTTGPTKGNLGNWTNITPADSFHRVEIAVAPSNGNIIYAVCQDNAGYGVDGMFKSTDGGSNWNPITIPNYIGSSQDFTRGQAWYNLICQVDPSDPNMVWVGGIDAHRSTDGGNNWTQFSYWYLDPSSINYIHADQHDIKFLPNTSDAAVWATDGGLSYSTNTNAMTPTFQTKNTGYNVTQFYGGGIAAEAGSNNMLAGAQDNGTHKFGSSGENSTTEVTGGDGAYTHIDATDSNFQISAYTYNNYWYTTNNWASYTQVFDSDNGLFINPTDFDDESNILYAANAPGNLTRISGFPSSYNTEYFNFTGLKGGQITALKTDPNTGNRVWVNSKNGTGSWQEILKIDNANASAVGGMSITAYPVTNMGKSLTVSCIQVEDGNPNHLVITSSNYGVNQIWETKDGGSSWQIQDGDLPDMPVRWFMFHPDGADSAYIATDLGVWYTDNLNGSSTNWVPANNSSMPNVSVRMLQYRASDRTLMAITHGRGVFTATISSSDTIRDLGTGVLASGSYTPNSGQIILNSSNTILSGSNITFTAPEAINLKPGFTVQSGATFSATISSGARLPAAYPEPVPYEYAYIPPRVDWSARSKVETQQSTSLDKASFKIYPNPVVDQMVFEWNQEVAQNHSILITDLNGKMVKAIRQSEFFPKGFQRISFNLASLPSGNYFISLVGESGKQTLPFIKQ